MWQGDRRQEGLVLFASLFIVSGLAHFFFPDPYVRIMPTWLPWPRALVAISGAAELLGGVGLLLRWTRRAAAWGLVILLVAVFPANVHAAAAHVPFQGLLGASWVKWLRLPFQIPLIYWGWQYTKAETRPGDE